MSAIKELEGVAVVGSGAGGGTAGGGAGSDADAHAPGESGAAAAAGTAAWKPASTTPVATSVPVRNSEAWSARRSHSDSGAGVGAVGASADVVQMVLPVAVAGAGGGSEKNGGGGGGGAERSVEKDKAPSSLRKGAALPTALAVGAAPLTPPVVSGIGCAPLMEPLSPVARAGATSRFGALGAGGAQAAGPASMRRRSLDRRPSMPPALALRLQGGPARAAKTKLREPFGLQAPSLPALQKPGGHRRNRSSIDSMHGLDLDLIVEGVAVTDGAGGGNAGGGQSTRDVSAAGKASGRQARGSFDVDDPGFSPRRGVHNRTKPGDTRFSFVDLDGLSIAAHDLDLQLRLASPASTESSFSAMPMRDPQGSPIGRLRLCSDSRGSCGRLWTREELAELNSLPGSRDGLTPSSRESSLGGVSAPSSAELQSPPYTRAPISPLSAVRRDSGRKPISA